MEPAEEPIRGGGPPIHLACSRGGHLDLLLYIRDAFVGHRLVWVTQRSDRAEHLRRTGAEVHVLGEYHRSAFRAETLRTVWRSLKVVLRQRPRVVVTSGAGIVVPFCVLARLAGAKVLFVETSARVRGPSSSGRVLSRVADRVIAQWEDMQATYPGAVIARTTVVRTIAPRPATPGYGTFVGVGTHSQPFDRLLAMVDAAAAAGVLPRPVLAQVGPSSYELRHAEARAFMTPEEMEAAVRGARYVVSHAGSGTITSALGGGRRPLLLPRLGRYGEHFDDHQQEITEKLASLDLAVPLGSQITAADLERADRPLRMPEELERLPTVAECVRTELSRLLAGL